MMVMVMMIEIDGVEGALSRAREKKKKNKKKKGVFDIQSCSVYPPDITGVEIS